MTDLSIIILSYNTKVLTKKCIQSVVASLREDPQIKTEIVVLDNASTDGSVEMLKGFKVDNLELKVIQNKKNLGFAKGNNKAVKLSKGKTLLFLNSDTQAISDAVPVLYRYFVSSDNTFDFVGAKLLETDGKKPQPSAGPGYTLPVVFAALFLRGDYWGLTRYSPDTTREVDWASGACLMTSKKTFDDLGGFDESIFMYMDEIDMLHRARKQRLSVGFYPEARFIHHGSASSAERTQPIIKVYEGLLYFYKKHQGPLQLRVLQLMLITKAEISLAIGRVFGNNYLSKTYEQALKVVKNSRR
ncbi:MAG: glycosyltransferase family 2 protein [Candidatus Paceibacterota bacterium]